MSWLAARSAEYQTLECEMSLVLEIPDTVEQALQLPPANRKKRLFRELAVALYAQNILSFGKARELADLNRYEFGSLLEERGIPRHYGEEELQEDLEYALGE